VDFFQATVDLFKTLDSYQFLADAGIVPSTSQTYTSDEIIAALAVPRGVNATIACSNGALDEIWYYFDVAGSIQTGQFVASNPDGSKSSCPSVVSYLPKDTSTSPTATSATASSTFEAIPTPTGPPFVGKGYLNVHTGGRQNGCIISSGRWYTTGTCATFSVLEIDGGFALKSSKGNCAIVDNALGCAKNIQEPTVFSDVGGSLAFNDNTTFYATDVPRGWKQGTVYTTEESVPLTIIWQGRS